MKPFTNNLRAAQRAALDHLDRLTPLGDPDDPDLPTYARGRVPTALGFAAATVATCACPPGVVHEVRITRTGCGSFEPLWVPHEDRPLVDLVPIVWDAWFTGTPGPNAARRRFERRDPMASLALKLVTEHEDLIRRVATALLLLGNARGVVARGALAWLCEWVRRQLPPRFVERARGRPADEIIPPDVVARLLSRFTQR